MTPRGEGLLLGRRRSTGLPGSRLLTSEIDHLLERRIYRDKIFDNSKIKIGNLSQSSTARRSGAPQTPTCAAPRPAPAPRRLCFTLTSLVALGSHCRSPALENILCVFPASLSQLCWSSWPCADLKRRLVVEQCYMARGGGLVCGGRWGPESACAP